MIVSFSKTTAALVARRKTVTRREWKDGHAARFKPGDVVDAWSASPHRGGKRVGKIRILSVTKEPTRLIPDSDWEAEGFAYMAERGLNVEKDRSCEAFCRAWRQHPTLETYVIRFEVVEILGESCEDDSR